MKKRVIIIEVETEDDVPLGKLNEGIAALIMWGSKLCTKITAIESKERSKPK
jgi:hypothetical protein